MVLIFTENQQEHKSNNFDRKKTGGKIIVSGL